MCVCARARVCVGGCVCIRMHPKAHSHACTPSETPPLVSWHVLQRNSECRSLSALRVSSTWMNGQERRTSERLESTGSPRGTETAMDSVRARELVRMRVASPRGSDERNGHGMGGLSCSPASRESNIYSSILSLQSPTRPEVQMSTRPPAQGRF